MPASRKTRATTRVEDLKVIHADHMETTEAANVPLPLTPKTERLPLGQLAANTVDQTNEQSPTQEVTPTKKKNTKARRKSATKKAAKNKKEIKKQKNQDEPVEGQAVLEDPDIAPTSPASQAASDVLAENFVERELHAAPTTCFSFPPTHPLISGCRIKGQLTYL